MRLLQAKEEAKRMEIRDNEKITFEIINEEERRRKCTWLDPWLGIFEIEGENGFRMTGDFQQSDPQVQNIKVEDIT